MTSARFVRRSVAAAAAFSLLVAVGSVASAADSTAKGPGTGAQPPGQGLGSSAALAQKTCSPNGHTNSYAVGLGPSCVNPWPDGKDNGGATAPGVTATTVNVIVYVPSVEMLAAASSGAAGPVNQATGEAAKIPDTVVDFAKVYDYAVENLQTYQLWGRKLNFETVVATGADETSQRADAVEVISKKPFMVVDTTDTTGGGAPVFSTAVAAKKIITVSASTTAEIAKQQSPYRWNYGADPDAGTPLAASFVGRTLSGKKARFAGDKAFTSKTRTFGVVYPTTGFDLDLFERLVKQTGGSALTEAVGFDPTDPATLPDQMPTLISKLKSSGVTSVVLFGAPAAVEPLTKAATTQDYSPEWIMTGFGYHEYDLFANSYDQEQMKHAFGLSVLFPALATPPTYLDIPPFAWYWGADQGNTWAITGGAFGFAYSAVHYAGPTLTAKNVKKGLFSAPAIDGPATGTVVYQSGYGKTVGLPYDSYALLGSDRAFVWYEADTPGIAQAANIKVKGLFMYMDGGARYSYKGMPKKEPNFFDTKGAVSEVPISAQYPGGKVPEASPCTQCPSSGGAP